MHAVLLPNSGHRPLSPVLFPAKSTIKGKKIADFSLHLTPRKREIQCPNSFITRSEGSRRKPPHRRFPSNKPIEEEEDDELKQIPNSAADNEEILALFRRIRSSISKGGESNAPRRRRRNRTSDPVSPDRNQSRERGEEIASSDLPRRPLSKFVRKSPIPMAPPPLKGRGSPEKGDEATKEREVEERGENRHDLKIDQMKVSELKEVARREGIKGFSKLKKGELLQLLKESLHTSS